MPDVIPEMRLGHESARDMFQRALAHRIAEGHTGGLDLLTAMFRRPSPVALCCPLMTLSHELIQSTIHSSHSILFDEPHSALTVLPSRDRALLNLRQVCQRVNLGKTTIYEWAKIGRFPAPIKLSARCNRWRAVDIEAWLESRAL